MSSIRLFLLRHGNTFEQGQTSVQIGLRTDLPLTSVGRQQAAAFGRYLSERNLTPSRIYCGSLSRQRDTASVLAEEFSSPPPVLTGEKVLDEIDYGRWEGLTNAEIAQSFAEEYRRWSEEALWPEGLFTEPAGARIEAIRAWTEELLRRHTPGDVVVAVSSGGIIRLFYSLLGDAWQRLIAERRMRELQVRTGHFCELELTSGTPVVRVWNVAPSAG